MNAFTWILVSFPAYLLINGKLLTFLKLGASSSNSTTPASGTTSATSSAAIPATVSTNGGYPYSANGGTVYNSESDMESAFESAIGPAAPSTGQSVQSLYDNGAIGT